MEFDENGDEQEINLEAYVKKKKKPPTQTQLKEHVWRRSPDNNPLNSDKSSDNFPEDTGGKVTEERRFQVTSLTGPLNGSMIQFIAPVNNFPHSLFRGRRLGGGLIYELLDWLPECERVWRWGLRFSTTEDFHLTCQRRRVKGP